MGNENVKNVGQILDDNAARLPNKECLISGNDRYTYKELNSIVNKAGNAFLDLGIRKDDRVLICLLNVPEAVISFFALAKIGAIAVPVNYMLTIREHTYLLHDSEASLVITDSAKLQDYYTAVTESKIPIITINQEYDKQRFQGITNFWDLIRNCSDTLTPCTCTREDVLEFLYTSGTTGNPKGAMLTHHSVFFCSSLFFDNPDIGEYLCPENARYLAALPLYHCYGQNVAMITPFAVGATVILLDRFNTEKVFQAIAEHHVSFFPGVPTMHAYLLNGFDPAKHDLSSMKYCISAGAALPLEVIKGFREKIKVDLVEGYGITEASAQALANPLTPGKKRKDGSIGIPLRTRQQETYVKVVDDNGQELPDNAVGEMIIKGDHVMKGYWKLPKETAKTIRDGWLFTGDLARRDEDGYFYIVDRKKDLIIVGGENVYPREIEEVILTNETVLEVAVVGVKGATKGEIVPAVGALKPGAQATEAQL